MTNELQIFCSLPKCEKDADTECIDCEYMVREEPKKRMSNEEAKKMLEAKLKCLIAETSGTNHDCNMRLCDECSLNYEQGNMGDQKQALEIAIKVLEQPSEDCISRQELLEELGEEPFNWNDSPEAIQEVRDYQWFRSLVENAPPVTPQSKVGKWIFHEPFDNGHKNCNECIECSQCHIWLGYDCYAKTPYCPICGAKMEVEE